MGEREWCTGGIIVMGKPKYLEENLPQGPLSLPLLTNLFKVYMEPTHDWWDKASTCYFGGGEKLTCLVVVVDDDDDDDDDDVVVMLKCHYSSLYYQYFIPFEYLCSNHCPLAAVIKNVFVTTKLLATRWTRELTDTSLMLQVYSPTGFEKYACTYTVGDYRIHFVVWDTSGKFHNMRSASYTCDVGYSWYVEQTESFHGLVTHCVGCFRQVLSHVVNETP